MLFTSYGFWGFAAALLVVYYLMPQKLQWPLLLAASYIFYWIAGAEYLVYILTTTLTAWFSARKIEQNALRQSEYLKEYKDTLTKDEKKSYKDGQKKLRRRWLMGCLLLNLGILAVVKYAGFVISNLNSLIKAAGGTGNLGFIQLALPLGISFYTFQAMGYLIDVYRGAIHAQENPAKLALFVSFFPLLIQGPISRYSDLAPTLYDGKRFDAKTVSFGLQRVLWGYFKKMVVADRIVTAVTTVIGAPDTWQGAYAFVGMVFYTIQLYADFTGGIDITIGFSQALGVTVQENFIRPYFSKSLKEYWRRWHISMCNWFRDYLFYPVSTSKWMGRFTKFTRAKLGDKVGRRLPLYMSSFIVWFSTGVWHGASWNFIVWGLLNWAVLMASEELEPLYAKFHRRFLFLGGTFGYKLFQVGRTFLLVCVLNLFDCYAAIGDTLRSLTSMVTVFNWGSLSSGGLLKLGLTGLDYGILAFGVLLMLGVSLVQRSGSVREKVHALPYPVRFAVWYGLFLLVLLLGAYGIGYDASQFIYNRF